MSGYLTATIYGPTYVGASIPDSLYLGAELVLSGPKSPYGDTNRLRFVQHDEDALASAAVGASLKFVGADIVAVTTNAGENMVGTNDISGVVIPAGSYFWMNVSGRCKPLVTGSINALTMLCPGATDGTLVAWDHALSTFQQCNVQSLAASGSGGQTLCYKD